MDGVVVATGAAAWADGGALEMRPDDEIESSDSTDSLLC
jgi:hypothetical protein